VTTIKRSKANETLKHKGEKIKTKIFQQNMQIPENLYATQQNKGKIEGKRKGTNKNLLNSENKELSYKPEVMLKYKKKSKEEIKHPSHFKVPLKGQFSKKQQNGIKRKSTTEKTISHDKTFTKKSLDKT